MIKFLPIFLLVLGCERHTKKSYDVPEPKRFSKLQYHPNESDEPMGSFYYRPGGKTVITAPHGDHDINTDLLVRELCDRDEKLFKDATCITANGFRSKKNTTRSDVNRPTAKPHSKCLSQDPISRVVFEMYRRLVENPNVYVEIHGFTGSDSRKPDVVTRGISITALQNANVDGWNIGEKNVVYTASQNRECGMLSMVGAYMHIELPRHMRNSADIVKRSDQLAKFILKAVGNR